MRILFTALVLIIANYATAQQVNPVPDYVFSNRMSVGRNAVTDTAAYFSIGPRYGANKGFMPPIVGDTAHVTASNKRNGLLIFSVQKNKFLYWDSVRVRWSDMAGSSGSYIVAGDTATMLSPYVRGSGSTNYIPKFTSSRLISNSKIFDNGTNIGIGNVSPLTPLHIGNRLVNNSVDAVLLVSRNVNDSSGSGNAHAFTDGSNVYRSGGMSYNSFDARINITGSNNMGHYAAFQAAPEYSNSGTMHEYFGFFSYIGTNAGTITHNYNNYVANPTGAGSVTNNYGLYVAAQTKGTNNYALHLNNAEASGRYNLYVNGTAYNYLNGRLGIGTSSAATMLDVVGTGQFSGELRLNSTGSQIKFGGQGTGTQTGIFQGSNSSILYISDYATGAKGIRIDAASGEVHISNSSDAGDYKLQVSGNAYVTGTYTSAAPTDGTAAPWKLGSYVTTAPSATGYVQVEINGVKYKLLAATY